MTQDKLPQVASSHIQSAESVRALQSVLCEPLFILRPVSPDYGVDFNAEVITDDNQATNWHVQIQLRSEARAHLVDNGAAISVGFKASALTYLFQGASRSIIVVYDAEHKVLVWEWTDRVIASLDAAGRDWRSQDTVTVRVPAENVLHAASADAIRREVLAYHRQAAPAQAHLVATGIGAATAAALEGLTRDALAALRANGLLLVSDGQHREVLQALRTIPETAWEQDLDIVLVAAFAYDRSGAPLQALYYANRIPDDVAGWGDENKALLAHIRSSARLCLGHIDTAAHWESLRALSEQYPQSFVAAQAALEVMARDVVFTAHQNANPSATVLPILNAARDLVEARTRETEKSQRGRWAIEVLLARVEMEVADKLLLAGVFAVGLSEALRVPMPVQERAALARELIQVQLAGADRLRTVEREADAAGVPEWVAIAHLTFLEAQVKRYGLAAAARAHVTPEIEAEGRSLLEMTIAGARALVEQFLGWESRLLAFRAKRLEGNALVMLGSTDAVVAVQTELASWARQWGLSPDAATLSDPPPQSIDERAEARRWANADEAMFAAVEELVLRQLGLPEDRRSVLRHESLATQTALREKLNWCRHLVVVQDLKHTLRKETYYAKPPPRVVQCELLHHESKLPHPDAAAVILAFKRAYCDACTRREPLEN